MTTKTAIKPGTLASVLHFANGGTCLSYGVVVKHVLGDGNHSGRITVRTPDGTEHETSDYGDYYSTYDLNAECGKCGAPVWRNLARGPWEGIPDVDATGSAKCPKGGFHGREA